MANNRRISTASGPSTISVGLLSAKLAGHAQRVADHAGVHRRPVSVVDPVISPLTKGVHVVEVGHTLVRLLASLKYQSKLFPIDEDADLVTVS